MILSSLMASFHYFGLAIAFGALFMRGRYLRTLALGQEPSRVLPSLFAADNFWGISALVLVSTGLLRAFGGLEKGSAFYLQNHTFWLKMVLLGLIIILEIKPMVTFIRWRIAVKRKTALPGFDSVPTLRLINQIQMLLAILIPFAASAMARGIGM